MSDMINNKRITQKENILKYLDLKKSEMLEQWNHEISTYQTKLEYLQRLQSEIKDDNLNYISEISLETCNYKELHDEINIIDELTIGYKTLLDIQIRLDGLQRKRTFSIMDSHQVIDDFNYNVNTIPIIHNINNNNPNDELHCVSSELSSIHDNIRNNSESCHEISIIEKNDITLANNFIIDHTIEDLPDIILESEYLNQYNSNNNNNINSNNINNNNNNNNNNNDNISNNNCLLKDDYPMEYLSNKDLIYLKSLDSKRFKYSRMRGKRNYHWESYSIPAKYNCPVNIIFLRPDIVSAIKSKILTYMDIYNSILYDNKTDAKIIDIENDDCNKYNLKRNIHYFYSEEEALTYFFNVIHNYPCKNNMDVVLSDYSTIYSNTDLFNEIITYLDEIDIVHAIEAIGKYGLTHRYYINEIDMRLYLPGFGFNVNNPTRAIRRLNWYVKHINAFVAEIGQDEFIIFCGIIAHCGVGIKSLRIIYRDIRMISRTAMSLFQYKHIIDSGYDVNSAIMICLSIPEKVIRILRNIKDKDIFSALKFLDDHFNQLNIMNIDKFQCSSFISVRRRCELRNESALCYAEGTKLFQNLTYLVINPTSDDEYIDFIQSLKSLKTLIIKHAGLYGNLYTIKNNSVEYINCVDADKCYHINLLDCPKLKRFRCRTDYYGNGIRPINEDGMLDYRPSLREMQYSDDQKFGAINIYNYNDVLPLIMNVSADCVIEFEDF